MEPFVVPAGHGTDYFLPSDVGQPVNTSHMSPNSEQPAKHKYSAYSFGVDPVWRYSSQNIQFTNSLKMKMSVILGVSQMTCGILLKWANTFHFKKWGYLGSVCIPELMFMCCTFGYMCFLIFLKWSTDYNHGAPGTGVPCWTSCDGYDPSKYEDSGRCFREPPMIITTLIGMFMSTGAVGQDQTNKWDRCKFYLFESQQGVQVTFLVIALICVPWLFAVDPILVYREHQASVGHKERQGIIAHTSEDSAEENEDEHLEDEIPDDDFAMGDVIVGQAIHAIEFILGCVSNTASYLRLWALSLAHSQLSEVFWEYIFKGYEIELLGGQYPGLASDSIPFIVVCYAVFFCCTIAVLMIMESLSAFLHALRLQWVEFQNKFYHATGYKFTPLDFSDTEMPFDLDM
jgi:V-type H+-transporting ATPase subunit a